MHAGVWVVGVVLDVGGDGAGGGGGEDVAVARVGVEGVAVDVVGWFLGGEDEDCAGVGVGSLGGGC